MSNEVRPITVKDSDTGFEYTLEFNRESVQFAEMRGFKMQDVSDYPMTKVPELWFYAFRMHHKNLSRQKTDALLNGLGGVPAVMNHPTLLGRLGELYAEPFLSMSDEQAEENPRVTVEL